MSFRRPPTNVERMTSIRVDNLPYSAMADDLQPLFERFGQVGDIYLPTERGTGRSRGFAFIRYFDKRDAEDAMDELNGRNYDGRDLRIRMDDGRPRREFNGGRGGGGYDNRRGGYGGRGRDDRRGDDRRGGGRRRSRSRSRSRSISRSRSRSRSGSRGDRRSRSPKGRGGSPSPRRDDKRADSGRSRSRS